MFHAPLIAATDGLELAAVLTRSPERAAAVARTHPQARVVAGTGELLDAADLVVVATPSGEHVAIAAAALARDLPVVVDKPLAPTAREARELLALGGPLTVFQNRRWDDDFLTLRALVDAGRLGAVHRFESRFERFRAQPDPQAWRESLPAAQGGGVLLDLGSHLVDQALVLLGPAVRVYAELAALRPGTAAEDDAFVAIEHEGGNRSHLWMSSLAPLAGPRLRVSGTLAGFASDGLDPQEAQLRDGKDPASASFGQGRSGLLDGRALALGPGRYRDFYALVREWARGAGAAPVDPRDALAVLEVLDAARRSAAQHAVVVPGP